MGNWWKLLITEPTGKKGFKRFEQIAVAVAEAKALRASGATVELVSGVHGFPPTKKAGPRPSAKHYWCAYCVKWRIFKLMAVRRSGLLGPEDMRCPTCLISDHDYYIRKYNHMLGTADMEMVYRLENAFQRQ